MYSKFHRLEQLNKLTSEVSVKLINKLPNNKKKSVTNNILFE